MFEWLPELFSSESFMPHGHCYLWKPGVLWLQVLSNALIGTAYLAISITLVYMIKKGQYLPFKGMALAFGLFIVSCGITHFMDVYVIWHPAYWLDGSIRAVTALASVVTALLLPPLVPRAIGLARGAKVAHERGVALEAVVADLAQLVEKTKELDRLKTQFFANVSHELRTPLALVLGPTERLLQADNLTDRQRRDLEVVVRNAQTLLRHVNDLLDVSRLEAGKLAAQYRRVDASALTRRIADHFEVLANERGTRFSIDTPSSLEVELDPDKLHRVIVNLLSNAFKFTAPGGIVRISLTEQDDALMLEVADDGPGIPPQHREAVFERFHQVEGGSTRSVGGTGLGLAIARDFVELHRGTISVGEATEGGASFRVRLPLRAPRGAIIRDEPAGEDPRVEAAVTKQALTELRASTDAARTSAGAERGLVLVVEDNPDMNRFICATLADDYRVESAFDGVEGLERARELEPDLVVSDIMMPRMSGDQLVTALRNEPSLPHVPILLLSAKDDDELRVKLLRDGAQDYVTKPFSAEELRARVGNLLEMKRARDVLQQEIETQMASLEQLAAEVTHRKRDLKVALDSMRVAREHAERASQLKSNFLSVVSHELRTPLATLQIQLERLRVEVGSDVQGTQSDLVDRMTSSASRLQSLIEELLHFTRIQSGHLEVAVGPIDLASLAHETAEQVGAQARRKGLSLVVDPAGDLPPLHSDPRLVRLILVNLVGNAIKYTHAGSVTIRLKAEADRHIVAVTDTGAGISPEDRARIFQPFEQLGSARKKHVEGIGLGLAMVSEMTRALHGSVTLDSELEKGSTFTVSLPSLTDSPGEASDA